MLKFGALQEALNGLSDLKRHQLQKKGKKQFASRKEEKNEK